MEAYSRRDEIVKGGENGIYQEDGEQYGHTGKDKGLDEELKDEVTAPAAEDLADPDLLEPLDGLGGGQVDEIDGCYQEDEGGDAHQGIKGREACFPGEGILVGRVEMQICQGL